MGISWQVLKEYLEDNAVEKGIPFSGAFEITGRCNLNCKMCYVHTGCNNNIKLKELSAKDWLILGKAAVEQGMLELLLSGGEVFLREDFREIYEGLTELGLLITIYTNGTLITPEIMSWLVQAPPKKIEVSIYGASEETYKKVCGDPSGLSKALNGIDLLQKGGIPLELRTTLTPDNHMEYECIAKLADDRGLKLGIVNYLSPQRDIKSPEFYRLSPEKLIEVEERINNYYKAIYARSNTCKNNTHIVSEENFGEGNLLESNLGEVFPQCAYGCTSGKSSFNITYDGRMTPCGLSGEIAAFPLKIGFKPAWETLKQLCMSTPQCPDCITCDIKSFCITCPTRLKNETNSYTQKSTYLCELALLKSKIF